MSLNYLVECIVRAGIPVTMRMGRGDLSGIVLYDLNSETKSGMYLYEDNNSNLVVSGRYDEHDVIYTVEDLCYIFKSRYQSHNYGSQAWLNLCERISLVQKTTKEVVEYKF